MLARALILNLLPGKWPGSLEGLPLLVLLFPFPWPRAMWAGNALYELGTNPYKVLDSDQRVARKLRYTRASIIQSLYCDTIPQRMLARPFLSPFASSPSFLTSWPVQAGGSVGSNTMNRGTTSHRKCLPARYCSECVPLHASSRGHCSCCAWVAEAALPLSFNKTGELAHICMYVCMHQRMDVRIELQLHMLIANTWLQTHFPKVRCNTAQHGIVDFLLKTATLQHRVREDTETFAYPYTPMKKSDLHM